MAISFKKKPNTTKQLDAILHPFVREWFHAKFPDFSLPQLYAVMEIHGRNNVLVSAPTGATKTLTGFLSILNELIDAADKGILEDRIYAVYVSPLKALNEDIKVNLLEPLEEIKRIAKDTYQREIDVRVAVRGGDTTTADKAKMLKLPPHILITTPESLAISMASPKFSEHLKRLEWCIIDEIHAIAESKRGTHLILSLERLEHYCGHITRIGLSATVSPLEEIARFLVGTNRDCTIVDVQFIKELDLQVLSAVDNLVDVTYKELHERTYALIDTLIQQHRTTLIFTNTRAATERVVHHLKEMFPQSYTENIGAHHGSLSKEMRHSIEQRLREGKLKCVVCSTSLELGIDIGFIDLVICLGSPKTVARTLQRIGRSGHKLHATTKGRIIVMDRDDLVECSVLLKNAVEKNIDKVHVPMLALDVLSQQLLGAAIEQVWEEDALYKLITQVYPYHALKRTDFNELLSYLAGEYAELEDRSVYAKIWRKEGKIGKRGKMVRILYMTNLGTIPTQSGIQVKLGGQIIGSLDEGFLERLRKRDIFVLGGQTYEFRYARGMTAVVDVSIGKPPTVPSWVSEMLPLSYDLAYEVLRFRGLMDNKLTAKQSKKEMLAFINKYLYVDDKAAHAIYEYMHEQHAFAKISHTKRLVIEYFKDEQSTRIIFHAVYGRRVNDCLSRAIAYIIARYEKTDVEVGVSDNGFYIATTKPINSAEVLKVLKTSDLYQVMDLALDKTEVLKRRFRHCAERSLMILRSYMGRTKRAGKQQSISTILINAVNRISHDFPILKEARREVLEDLMDIKHAQEVIHEITEGTISIEEVHTTIPSPFAFQLVLQGYTDILKIDDKLDFLKRMHEMVLAKIALEKGKKKEAFSFQLPRLKKRKTEVDAYDEYLKQVLAYGSKEQKKLARQLRDLKDAIPVSAKFDMARIIYGQRPENDIYIDIRKYEKHIQRQWPRELGKFFVSKAHDAFSYKEQWDEHGDTQIDAKESAEEQHQKLLMKQFHAVHKELNLEPLIYFELEKLIENPESAFDKKFKKWLKELLTPPIPKIWPKALLQYMKKHAP